jgi:acetyl-CoA acetyltransferase
MMDYQGVALVTPVSLGYQRQSPHGAPWFIGSVLRELIQRSGIRKEDVDGFAVSSFSLGFDSAIALTQHFQLSPRWIEQLNYGGVSGLLALRRGARAIQCGDASIIACIGGDSAFHRSFEQVAANFSSFTVDASFPYGAGGPNTAFSLITQHYMDTYGITREDFARLCLDQRYNANHYPPALLGHKTLSLEAYLGARPIAGPLHLFDCVMPCAGGEGFLMMSEARAQQLRLPYARILSADERHNSHREDPLQFRGGWTEFAADLFNRARLTHDDIDILHTYDDYPVISLMQIEDLGFCAKGAGAAWLQETDMRFDHSGPGTRKLPHNTCGGQLSAGQAGSAAGFMGVVEALRQLTRQAQGHQVPDAETALVSGYGMINYDRGLCSAASILARGDV